MVKLGVLQNRPNTIYLLIILHEILFNTTAVFAAEENSRSGYFVTRENKRLPGHVIKRFGSPSLMSCSQSCLRSSWCTSTNFKESSKLRDEGTCELNKHDSAPISEDAELVDQPGVSFSMFLKGCLMTGCLNGGSCLFGKENETFSCSCKQPWSGEKCGVSFLDIYIRSEGCDDPGIAPGTCGFAFIELNGQDHSPRSRGHNVVVVDAKTGFVLDAKVFDTHADNSSGIRFRDYLNGIHGDKIVLVAIQDEGSVYISPAIPALQRLGATDAIPTDHRGTFAFVGYAQANKPAWIAQERHNGGKGPSEIYLKIPLPQSQPSN